MPRLSAIDSVNPALARVKWMLLPFRLTTWLKVGLIGWLAGEAISSSGGVNYRFPGSLPGGGSIPPVSLPNIHFPVGLAIVVAVIAAVIAVISIVMLYVSCRSSIRSSTGRQVSSADGLPTGRRPTGISAF